MRGDRGGHLVAVLALADHDQRRRGGAGSGAARTHQLLVVDQQDPDQPVVVARLTWPPGRVRRTRRRQPRQRADVPGRSARSPRGRSTCTTQRPVGGPALSRAPSSSARSAIPEQPGPAGSRRRRAGRSLVTTSSPGSARHVEPHRDPGAGRVLGHVGQRLLDDPVEAEGGGGGTWARSPRGSYADVEPGAAEVRDQGRRRPRARRRRGGGGLAVAAEQADGAPDVGHGLAADPLGLAERGHGVLERRSAAPVLGGVLEVAAGGGQVEHRHAERVRDQVVHLPGDALRSSSTACALADRCSRAWASRRSCWDRIT